MFYAQNGGGHGQIYYALFNGTSWTANTAMQMPIGFSWVGAPSASARIYQTTAPKLTDSSGNTVNGVFDLAFPGRLGGETHSDIYFGRIAAATTGNVGQPLSGFLDLPQASGEPLTAQTRGTYYSSGVAWDTAQQIVLSIVTPSNPAGVVLVNTSLTSPPFQVNPTTGIIAADNSVLGGKVYLNPATGTVQFTNGSFAANVSVTLTYTPRLLRVSSGAVTATHPVVLYDNRVDSNLDFWCTQGNVAETTPQPDDRYDFIYTAPSSGAGQAARMYMSTYRLGLVLPEPVETGLVSGSPTVTSLTVSGNNGPYQIDPTKGRVYFTDVDEGNTGISITYTGVSSTGVTNIFTNLHGATVSWMNESAESAVPLDSAVNEGQVSAFLDPFDQNNTSGVPRPGMIWLFWTSTRGGGPDVFFQTIAPNFTPVVPVK